MLAVKLRPHHLLCISFFEGKGYSDEFVDQMSSTIQELEKNPLVQLVEGADQLCESCPNNSNHHNNCMEKAGRYDEAVRSLCDLSSECILNWFLLQEKVSENILQTGKLFEVCGDCEWYSICSSKDLSSY